MEIQSMKTFSTAFALLTKVSVGIAISSIAFAGFVWYSSSQEISKLNSELKQARKSLVIIDPSTGVVQKGGFVMQDAKIREREYKHVVEIFIKNMYQLDAYTYEGNINTALNYSGKVGQEIVHDFEANYLFAKLSNENMAWYINYTPDAIKIEERGDGFIKGTIYAVQTIKKPMGSGKRNFHAAFTVRDAEGRSETNLHGAIVDSWNIINNDIIKD